MFPTRILLLVVGLAGLGGVLFAQTPVINPEGVVNAASYVTVPGWGRAVAPGSIASIFGQNLSPVTEQAATLPLPFELGGVRVTIAGLPAPLFYVSPEQINVQVPRDVQVSGPGDGDWRLRRRIVDVTVTTPEGTSEPVQLMVSPQNIGVFTVNESGCGLGAVLNPQPDGTVQFHGPHASVAPGDWVSVYFTGMGWLVGVWSIYNMPEDGRPAVISGPYPLLPPPWKHSPWIELAGKLQVPWTVNYFGKAPGTVGLDQFNFRIPLDAPEGCAIPLRLPSYAGGYYSQPIPLSIHPGRGQCVPTPVSLALVEWRKTSFNDLRPTEDLLYYRLNEAEGNAFPELPEYLDWPQGGYTTVTPVLSSGQMCESLLPAGLDGGTLTALAPGSPPVEVLSPTGAGGETVVPLEPGTIGAGNHSITGQGGPQMGSFQSVVTIPAPVEIATELPPGSILPCDQPLEIRWTRGDDSSWVEVTLRRRGGDEYPDGAASLNAPGSTGLLTIQKTNGFTPPPPALSGFCGSEVDVIVTQIPHAATISEFSADGLTLGGRHTWKYEFRFEDLRVSE